MPKCVKSIEPRSRCSTRPVGDLTDSSASTLVPLSAVIQWSRSTTSGTSAAKVLVTVCPKARASA